MLGSHYLVDEISLRNFLMNTQDEKFGGFSKYEYSVSGIIIFIFYFLLKNTLNYYK